MPSHGRRPRQRARQTSAPLPSPHFQACSSPPSGMRHDRPVKTSMQKAAPLQCNLRKSANEGEGRRKRFRACRQALAQEEGGFWRPRGRVGRGAPVVFRLHPRAGAPYFGVLQAASGGEPSCAVSGEARARPRCERGAFAKRNRDADGSHSGTNRILCIGFRFRNDSFALPQ